jgi:hypothetical protein
LRLSSNFYHDASPAPPPKEKEERIEKTIELSIILA